MNCEIWKDIPGYEGEYQASDQGRIKSLSRTVRSSNQSSSFDFTLKESILQPGKRDKCGHLSVVLHNPRKSFGVHKLVMLAFVGKPPSGCCVLHNNGNPADNRLSNLRYDTQSENIIDVFRQGRVWRKLSAEDAKQIKFGLHCKITCRELGKMYGVTHQTISKIKNGARFSWIK
jgi:hypothetical protein